MLPGVTDDLVRRLVEASELHGDFVLSSGKRSSVYFDKFLFLTRPDLLRELAHAIASMLPPGVDHLAAPEGAATLLVAALALETGLPAAVVRKDPKPYGGRSKRPQGCSATPGSRSNASCSRSTGEAPTTCARRGTRSMRWSCCARRTEPSPSQVRVQRQI
jgi:hypothetical protein